MIIYKIENKINGKIYVGKTRNTVSQRVAEHLVTKSHIGNALRKYGIESFSISVIDYAINNEIASEKEIYWIKELNCKSPNGYNHTVGGEGLVNPSQEVKKAISDKIKSLEKNPNFTFEGHSHTEESKKKAKESLQITNQLPEVKARRSASGKGKPKSEAHKKAIGEANKGKLKGRVPWNKGKRGTQIPWNKDHNHPAYAAYIEKVIKTNKERSSFPEGLDDNQTQPLQLVVSN